MREQILYAALPYLAALSLLVVPVWRGLSTRSTPRRDRRAQREVRRVYWGSWAWHWGLGLLFAGHLLAFLFPAVIALWNRWGIGTAVMEGAGLALTGMTLGGFSALLLQRWRARPNAESPPLPFSDTLFLTLLLLEIVSGMAVAFFYRWGSTWYADTLLPYVRSLARLRPDTALLAAMPMAVRLHTVGGFAAVAVLPFTRLGVMLARPWSGLRRKAPAF